jgi:YgiT-type zinc finger domain-containing protein
MVLKKIETCPVCKGRASLKKYTAKLFNGELKVKDSPIYECTKCGEEFGTGESLDEGLAIAKQAFSFQRKVICTGGSLAITLPMDISAYYKLKRGSKITLIPCSKNQFSIITSQQ